MKKVIAIIGCCALFFFCLAFHVGGKEKINWVSFSELDALYAKSPRPILIDVDSDWCGWCKQMDRTTYSNSKLAKYVNEHYYAVKLNAESDQLIKFNGKEFGYDSRNNTNGFAKFLLFNRMEFPSTVFLPTIDATPAPLPGYMKAREMEAPLKYFGEGIHKTQTFIDFNKDFRGSW